MVQKLPINNTYIHTFRGTGFKNGPGEKDNPRNLSIFCFKRFDILDLRLQYRFNILLI